MSANRSSMYSGYNSAGPSVSNSVRLFNLGSEASGVNPSTTISALLGVGSSYRGLPQLELSSGAWQTVQAVGLETISTGAMTHSLFGISGLYQSVQEGRRAIQLDNEESLRVSGIRFGASLMTSVSAGLNAATVQQYVANNAVATGVFQNVAVPFNFLANFAHLVIGCKHLYVAKTFRDDYLQGRRQTEFATDPSSDLIRSLGKLSNYLKISDADHQKEEIGVLKEVIARSKELHENVPKFREQFIENESPRVLEELEKNFWDIYDARVVLEEIRMEIPSLTNASKEEIAKILSRALLPKVQKELHEVYDRFVLEDLISGEDFLAGFRENSQVKERLKNILQESLERLRTGEDYIGGFTIKIENILAEIENKVYARKKDILEKRISSSTTNTIRVDGVDNLIRGIHRGDEDATLEALKLDRLIRKENFQKITKNTTLVIVSILSIAVLIALSIGTGGIAPTVVVILSGLIMLLAWTGVLDKISGYLWEKYVPLHKLLKQAEERRQEGDIEMIHLGTGSPSQPLLR